MSFLFGSAPKVTTPPPQPTIDPTQQAILQGLAGNLQSGAVPAGVQAYSGTFAAPQTQGQGSVIQQLLDTATGINNNTNPATNLATNLPNLIAGGAAYKAPNVTAPQISFAPQTPTIDPTDAFVKGVVAPLTSNFQQTVIPSLNAGAGRSAGGIYSSDLAGATDQALSNLDQTIAGTGAQYALGAQTANQGAQLTTNQLLGQIEMANQNATEATNSLNVGADLSGQSLDLSALSQAPGAIGASYLPGAETSSILESLFPTISTPQTTAQTQLTGQYQDFLNQITQAMQLRGIAAGVSTPSTQSTNTVVSPGQTGLVPSVLSGLAGNAGLGASIAGGASSAGSALMSLLNLSDERVKEDVTRIGRTDRSGLPVYTFRYKGEPENVRHVGLMAQEVEKKYPQAVGRLPGTDIRTVNYASVALAEAFPEKKAA